MQEALKAIITHKERTEAKQAQAGAHTFHASFNRIVLKFPIIRVSARSIATTGRKGRTKRH
jgi:hypothetical protein